MQLTSVSLDLIQILSAVDISHNNNFNGACSGSRLADRFWSKHLCCHDGSSNEDKLSRVLELCEMVDASMVPRTIRLDRILSWCACETSSSSQKASPLTSRKRHHHSFAGPSS